MNALARANWLIDNTEAVVKARRVRTDITGRIVVSATSTHLLARRAVTPWWEL